MNLFETGWPRRKLAGQLIWFGTWAVVTGLGLGMRPSSAGHGTHTQLGLPPCPSVVIFDRPCPGCGLTTSWTAFLHGDFALAFSAHPLGPPLYLAFAVSALLGFAGYFKGLRLRTEGRWANTGLAVALFGLLAFGTFRFATTKYGHSWADLLWRGEKRGQAARVPEQDPATNLATAGQVK